jgi:hypothetical protein
MGGEWEGEFALAEVTSDAVKALQQRSQRRGGGRGAYAQCCFHICVAPSSCQISVLCGVE